MYQSNIELFRLILQLKEPLGANNLLQTACERGKTEFVRMLLDMPLDHNATDDTNWGHRKTNPAADDNSAIKNACRYGHTEIVRMLLALPPECGVNPWTERHACAFWFACNRGYAEIVRLILNHGPVHDEMYNRAFSDACTFSDANNRVECVRVMLEHGGIHPKTLATIQQQKLHADILAEIKRKIQPKMQQWLQSSAMFATFATSFFQKKK
jgi:ankyrin repeat protein